MAKLEQVRSFMAGDMDTLIPVGTGIYVGLYMHGLP